MFNSFHSSRKSKTNSHLLFEFNIYSSLLLPFVIQGTVFAILLFVRSRKNQRLADSILAMILILYTLRICQWMLGFAGWYDARDWHTTFMFYLPFSHWLAIGPLIYFYFRSVTNTDFRFRRKDLLHFLPELVWLLRWIYIFTMDVVVHHWATGEPLPFFDNTHGRLHEEGIGLPWQFWSVIEYLSVFTYLVITLRMYHRYRAYLTNEFSNTEQIDFRWLRDFIVANLIGHLIWLFFDIADLAREEPLSYIQGWYSYFFLGILIYYLSITGYGSRPMERQEANLHFDPDEPVNDAATDPAEEPDEEMEKMAQKLIAHMERQKPFLDSGMNLTLLSRSLNASPSLVSRAINVTQHINFNDFINKYRVEAVCEKISSSSDAHLSLLAIALDCGFNSKATFNRAFKKHTGISPSAYSRKIKKEAGSK